MTDIRDDRLAWFAGNRDALDLYERLVFVAHAWDDLIDGDRPADVNGLVMNLLLHLPGNPFYRTFEGELRALFLVGATGYLAANRMEKSGDAHRIELAHYLRYAVSGVATFMISVLNGPDKGAEILAEVATVLIPERLTEYLKEHTNDQTQK